jgi:hypothetical protein
MGLRFRKSIKLIPGVRLNVGLRGASLSVGGRGLTYNVGSKGSRVTVGIPGSGLSYSSSVSYQTAVGLLANAQSSTRRFSATPIVIFIFVVGLIYLALRPSDQAPTPVTTPPIERVDSTGSIVQSGETASQINGPIPLPRARPREFKGSVGPPLQITPQ